MINNDENLIFYKKIINELDNELNGLEIIDLTICLERHDNEVKNLIKRVENFTANIEELNYFIINTLSYFHIKEKIAAQITKYSIDFINTPSH